MNPHSLQIPDSLSTDQAPPDLNSYLEIISTLRSYLTQEHTQGSWIDTDKDTYAYFAAKASAAPKNTKIPTTTDPKQKDFPRRSEVLKPVTPRIEPQQSSTIAPLTHKKVLSPQHVVTKSPDITSSLPIVTSFSPKVTSSTSTQKTEIHLTLMEKNIRLDSDFSEMHAYFKKKLPSIALCNDILDDSLAKAISVGLKTASSEVLILSFSEHPKDNAFLKDLAKAISYYLASAEVVSAHEIEEENGWKALLHSPHLRFVISNHNALHSFPDLQGYYRDDSTGNHTLGKAKLYLLSDLTVYMQQPHLKAALWSALCKTIPSKNTPQSF